jgi:hypothetical protein
VHCDAIRCARLDAYLPAYVSSSSAQQSSSSCWCNRGDIIRVYQLTTHQLRIRRSPSLITSHPQQKPAHRSPQSLCTVCAMHGCTDRASIWGHRQCDPWYMYACSCCWFAGPVSVASCQLSALLSALSLSLSPPVSLFRPQGPLQLLTWHMAHSSYYRDQGFSAPRARARRQRHQYITSVFMLRARPCRPQCNASARLVFLRPRVPTSVPVFLSRKQWGVPADPRQHTVGFAWSRAARRWLFHAAFLPCTARRMGGVTLCNRKLFKKCGPEECRHPIIGPAEAAAPPRP